MIRRRGLLKQLAAGAAVSLFDMSSVFAHTHRERFHAEISHVERRHGGRLGVAMWDIASDYRNAYRADERFLLCSTVKFPVAALKPSRVDAGNEPLERHIVYNAGDLVTYSPKTKHTEGSGVVFTTAVPEMLGFPGISAVAASKAALRSMIRSLAKGVAPAPHPGSCGQPRPDRFRHSGGVPVA